jgi:hypothetical protein
MVCNSLKMIELPKIKTVKLDNTNVSFLPVVLNASHYFPLKFDQHFHVTPESQQQAKFR